MLLGVTCIGAVHAAPPGPYPSSQSRSERGSGSGMSLDQAVARVRAETGGRILSATTEYVDGRAMHRIKVLTPDGRVRIIRVGP
ncbi:PepSY domain-containing protein, partial [Endothiovibrio diazotrophicus]